MSVFHSKAAGSWTSGGQTTWQESGVPTTGDTVIISHAVTLSSSTSIGNSVGYAITMQLGSSLTLAAGVQLLVFGDISDSSLITLGNGSSIVYSVVAPYAPASATITFTGATPRLTRIFRVPTGTISLTGATPVLSITSPNLYLPATAAEITFTAGTPGLKFIQRYAPATAQLQMLASSVRFELQYVPLAAAITFTASTPAVTIIEPFYNRGYAFASVVNDRAEATVVLNGSASAEVRHDSW